MPFTFNIPTQAGAMPVSMEPGASVIFVGANGGGKTRLAVLIEKAFDLKAHRISAHRALTLNPAVPKISEKHALGGLRTGRANDDAGLMYRGAGRWKNNEVTSLLNDFDYLVQALFAEQANKSLETHTKARKGDHTLPEPTKLERLSDIWNRLLPHRTLHISGDDIQAHADHMGDGTDSHRSRYLRGR